MKGILEWEALGGVIIILLYLISFLLIWQFVGYPSLMGIIALTSKPETKDYAFQPFVSIMVPTYNEKKVIAKRIIRDNHL
ncbi:hypothetical protein C5S31_06825 [ANME-1 cluster archaeon GoMg2]|nr:hypothetical protein [ANME-1 cluster archaeon GoMg2]